MYHVYVFYSLEDRKTFVGFSNDLASLLAINHCCSSKEVALPSRHRVLLHVERYETKKSASIRERELKTVEGKEFIRRLIDRKFGLQHCWSVRYREVFVSCDSISPLSVVLLRRIKALLTTLKSWCFVPTLQGPFKTLFCKFLISMIDWFVIVSKMV